MAGYRQSFLFFLVLLSGSCWPALVRADVQLCNRMSYIAEAAIALEDGGQVTTRGWFRVDPGQCRMVLQGTLTSEQVYVHARTPAIYGPSPIAQQGSVDYCVAAGNFTLSGAQKCNRSGQSLVRFAAVKPSAGERPTLHLAEEAEYTETQARDAGIQRLLVVAGYDANPIDGMRGDKTEAVLSQFLPDNGLPPTAPSRADFFDTLLRIAQKPGNGLSWCNDTSHPVMAAVGFEDKGTLTTRGWYRVDPGKCTRPDVPARAAKLYSFAEAVDADGQPLRRSEKIMSWGGEVFLCTRAFKFELSEQGDCQMKGLNANGFTQVDFAGGNAATLRFR